MQDAVFPSTEAVIVAVPGFKPSTKPEDETDAISAPEVTDQETSFDVFSTVAVNCIVSPALIEAEVLFNVIETTLSSVSFFSSSLSFPVILSIKSETTGMWILSTRSETTGILGKLISKKN